MIQRHEIKVFILKCATQMYSQINKKNEKESFNTRARLSGEPVTGRYRL